MKENKWKVLIVEPNKEPYTAEIGSDLKSLQKIVGGYIACVSLKNDVRLVYNDSVAPDDLQFNIHEGRSIVEGNFLVCGVDDVDFCSLTDKQIAEYSEQFRMPEMTLDEELAEDMEMTVISM